MRCIDVAALFAAAILRPNPDSVVIPFDTSAYDVKMDPNDSILSIAERLAKYGGAIQAASGERLAPLAKTNIAELSNVLPPVLRDHEVN